MSLLVSIFISDILPIFAIATAGFLLARYAAIDVRMVARVVFYSLLPCLAFRLLVTSTASGPNVVRLMLLAVLSRCCGTAPRCRWTRSRYCCGRFDGECSTASHCWWPPAPRSLRQGTGWGNSSVSPGGLMRHAIVSRAEASGALASSALRAASAAVALAMAAGLLMAWPAGSADLGR